MDVEALRGLIRDVPDFPEPGIVFKDITPVLADPAGLNGLIEATVAPFADTGVTKVAGIEARVHPRQPGGEPPRCGVRPPPQAGQAPMEGGPRGIQPGVRDRCPRGPQGAVTGDDRVLVVDDVIATGGTARAKVRLLQKLGLTSSGSRCSSNWRFSPARTNSTAFPSTPWLSMTDLAHRDAAIAELGPVLRPYHEHHPDSPDSAILDAYRLAERMHRGQFRKSGEPFIVHPIAVTAVLADYGLDVDTLVAALLHDTVEDTDLTLDEVRQRFGEQVALMIDGVTKLDRIKFGSQEEAQAATIRKMVVAMAQDVRVLLIKLADRLHNLRTIAALRPEKQQRIAKETLEVYAPLAHRLGMEEVKHEMEDRCFAVLQPLRYQEIQNSSPPGPRSGTPTWRR